MTSPVVEEFSEQAKDVVRKFVHKISHDGLHNLRMQYNELRSFAPANFSHVASDTNPTKCRYKDIICLDATRVLLRWPPGMTDDFVHANWVSHELFENRYICSQAPLDSTIGEFWRICWQENVRQILMLCRCEEMGKAKCAQYWPAEVDQQKSLPFGLVITCQKVDRTDKNFIHTRLVLTFGQESRKLDHRQWTTWPDKSVPQTPLAPFRLLHYTRKFSKHPSLIHCSAGVGRTGTMVAIEMMYKSLSNAIMPDTVKLVQALRSQRYMAVQTEDQYVYSLLSIIQFSYAKKMASKHDVKMFCKEYNNYTKMVMDNGGRPPPLNATKPPLDCIQCLKRLQDPNISFKERMERRTDRDHPMGKKNDETDCDQTVSPLQTKMSPSGLSPIHRVQSVPNWSSIDTAGFAQLNQQAPKKQFDDLPIQLGNDALQDAVPADAMPLTENTYNAASAKKMPPNVVYRPSNTYTVTGGGNEPKKIVYHRNMDKPFVKAIAGTGGPAMQISMPKYQLDEFHRQIRLKMDEIERKKKLAANKQGSSEAAKKNPEQAPR